MLFNAHWDTVKFTVPDGLGGSVWQVQIDTSTTKTRDLIVESRDEWETPGWSIVVLQRLDGSALDTGSSASIGRPTNNQA